MQCVSVINQKVIRNWLIISVLSILFSFVYECFSFGVLSVFMLTMPLIPLLMGLLPAMIMADDLGRVYNDGVLVLMSGFTLCGILEIYGTSSVYPPLMIAIGGALVLAGIIVKLKAS